MSARVDTIQLAEPDLARLCGGILRGAGADEPTREAVLRALLHASRLGIDSHGVRLLPHYVRAFEGGRVNPSPTMRWAGGLGATAILDAGHGHGALAAYRASERAVELSRTHGMGAVAIRNSSHFGAAGAYALPAAEAGCIGLAFCNSDSFVRLHGGAERFHGTNPIAMAAPVEGGMPWLLDMATSAIPYNRVQLYKSLGTPLPAGTASIADGADTTDAEAAEMLAPLGGEFGFKGAGLAGIVEIFSAVLTGMRLSNEILPMPGPDFSTPRELGAFVMAIDPAAFGEPAAFQAGMRRYLAAIGSSRGAQGQRVMAPGEREWAVARERSVAGIPVDPQTMAALNALAARYDVPLPGPRHE